MSHTLHARSRESIIHFLRSLTSTTQQTLDPISLGHDESRSRAWEILSMNWHLGFTAFGSPPVHFQIYHKMFVEKHQWIDEQLYQELFGLSQALPGPASTKMLYCVNFIRGGFFAGLLAFFLWSLPGAIGMYGLSLGVTHLGDTLPAPVYALLSGLNAATVGIIALAAVQLAEKAVTDKVTRLLVFLGGAAGMLYTALWYYPVLILTAGIVTTVWDYRWINLLFRPFLRRRQALSRNTDDQRTTETSVIAGTATTRNENVEGPIFLRRVQLSSTNEPLHSTTDTTTGITELTSQSHTANRIIPPAIQLNFVTWKKGVFILVSFLITFMTVMLLRALIKSPPLGISLFANFYLAGTIIFGGGPVVIPLLREYIVVEGWVSARDFLLGLAIIQAFPGPNFNFAVYLGALAAAKSSLPHAAGGVIGFVGIFTPGLVIITGVMGLWSLLRSPRWFLSVLRGVNAGAVGLVFTAVYKLWQIGYVDGESGNGRPLGGHPFWVAITAGSFVGGKWFGVSAPLAILFGGILGLVWFGIVKT